MDRPNIVVVITHDSGRQFGCYGAGVETPNIDRLAQQGACFTNAFCTAPQCSPARASAWTGLYPHRHGLIGLAHLGFRLRPDVPRLPQLLADAGYRTLLFGLQHEVPGSEPERMGYGSVFRGKSTSILHVMPHVRRFLGGRPDQPFFACIGFNETHRPFPGNWPSDDPRNVRVPDWLPNEEVVRKDLADLHGMVRGVDQAVGEIDDLLAQAGLARDTWLIYTTDHGIAFPRAKATLRDAGLEVALVVRGPGEFEPGTRVDRLTSTMDLTPTLLELAGAETPDDLDGLSLLPLLADRAAPWRDHLFAEQTFHAAYDPVRGVRTGRWKYIRSFADRPMMFLPNVDDSPTKTLLMDRGEHAIERPAELLYDLETDPAETTNRADDPDCREVLTDLRERVNAWMEETDDPLVAGQVEPPEGAHVTPAGAVHPIEEDVPDDWRVNC
ncbi:MAG: sulfatase [Planctomycetota bacterium]